MRSKHFGTDLESGVLRREGRICWGDCKRKFGSGTTFGPGIPNVLKTPETLCKMPYKCVCVHIFLETVHNVQHIFRGTCDTKMNPLWSKNAGDGTESPRQEARCSSGVILELGFPNSLLGN